MRLKSKRASSIIDYALLIFAVIAGLLIIGTYLKRGIAGKWKEAGDTFGFGRQYSGEIILE